MKSITKALVILAASAATLCGQGSALLSPSELAALRRLEPERAKQGMQFLVDSLQRNGLDNRYTFRGMTNITDPWGTFHGRYREYYNGLRVVGGNAIVHIDRTGQITKPTLKLFAGVYVQTTPDVSEADATAKARATYDATGRIPVETSEVELLIHVETKRIDHGEPPATGAPAGYRRYETVPKTFQLAWQVGVASTDGSSATRIYLVDATNGRIFRDMSQVDHDSTEQGEGLGFFQGPTKFQSLVVSGPAYWSDDPNRLVSYLNARHGTSEKANKYSDFTDANNKWGDGVLDDGTSDPDSKRAQTAYVDARRGVSAGWDLMKYFGRHGYDGTGDRVYVRLHWNEKSGTTYTDAHWHPSALANRRGMFLGDGPVSTSLKTTAHELGHGFFHSIFGWTYKPDQEWAGINEGNSDVMGSLAEMMTWKAPGETTPFTQMDGEWRWDSRMVNPAGYKNKLNGQTVYGQSYWNSYLGDDEEHTVGCLFGHLFIFMADGASSDKASPLYSVNLPYGLTGIGVKDAAFYWYWAMVSHFPEKGDYFDLHDAFLDAANSSYTPSGVRNVINAAFRGIAAGDPFPGGDSQAPAISNVSIEKIDEAAGYLTLGVEAVDNYAMARVDVYLDNVFQFSDTRLPYGGPVDLAGKSGNHVISVEAFDIYGNKSTVKKSVNLNGVRQLITNGGFEDGNLGWGRKNGAAIFVNSQLSFAGANYARLVGGSSIYHDFTVPATANTAVLNYRIRFDGHDNDGFQDQQLIVELLNAKDQTLVKTLATHDELDETYDGPLTRTYKQVSIPISQRGELRLNFRVKNGSTHKFKVDNVSVTFTEIATAKVTALARPADQTVEFTTTYSGIDPASIKSIQYYLDDAYTKNLPPVASGAATVLIPTTNLSAKQHSVTVVIRGANNVELVKAGVYFNVAGITNLIQNGGFEEGLNHWPVTGGAIVYQPVLDTLSPCFISKLCGILGQNTNFPVSTLSQTYALSVPAKSLTLSYRLRVATGESSNKSTDTFHVYFVDNKSQSHPVGKTYSNLTSTEAADSYDEFIVITETLPAALLQSGAYRLVFESSQNNNGQTRFYVDNVALVKQGEVIANP